MSFEALVLLGCPVGPNGWLAGAAERRVARAAQAFHAGLGPWILVCGGRVWHGKTEAAVFKRHLQQLGVPENQIFTEEDSQNTIENAYYGARFLAARHVRQIGLVSCEWHLPRACRDFRYFGLLPAAVAAPSPALPWHKQSYRLGREKLCTLLDACALHGGQVPKLDIHRSC